MLTKWHYMNPLLPSFLFSLSEQLLCLRVETLNSQSIRVRKFLSSNRCGRADRSPQSADLCLMRSCRQTITSVDVMLSLAVTDDCVRGKTIANNVQLGLLETANVLCCFSDDIFCSD